jgi:hypothetical protein
MQYDKKRAIIPSAFQKFTFCVKENPFYIIPEVHHWSFLQAHIFIAVNSRLAKSGK